MLLNPPTHIPAAKSWIKNSEFPYNFSEEVQSKINYILLCNEIDASTSYLFIREGDECFFFEFNDILYMVTKDFEDFELIF